MPHCANAVFCFGFNGNPTCGLSKPFFIFADPCTLAGQIEAQISPLNDKSTPPELREWRKRRGLNQLEAAAELGVGRDPAKISKWEKGRQMPRKPVLLALLARLKEGAQ